MPDQTSIVYYVFPDMDTDEGGDQCSTKDVTETKKSKIPNGPLEKVIWEAVSINLIDNAVDINNPYYMSMD